MIMAVGDFLKRYELYDKVVLSVLDSADGKVTLTFDLYTDDDQERNDYSKEYILSVTVGESEISSDGGPLFRGGALQSGQVLEEVSDGDALYLGVEWSNYVDNSEEWIRLKITAKKLYVNEVVVDRQIHPSGGEAM
ncbi:hypothetical protein [Paracoccus fistulariae]|uniref:Uncharacterized protein n=1 Tax=Paracoccus fistulariae TaxID=658446 RepID=A0ABY7SGL1_9RHOB|nr:hypothetical protein [Paracoccus fistulariae]MDB6181653.1 hypothetical protein [Paracoccus fistulariae]WCR06040.1 hypothetical protein JHX87_11015 [Paracoccus fistulariae]